MFLLQSSPIDLVNIKNSYQDPANGALVIFEGLVRNDKIKTREVAALFYVADEDSCLNEGNLIINQAMDSFHLNQALCVQRTGQVTVGQIAIWIGAWAPHRNDAFQGCRYIIEETKKRLLIWKKELYKDGSYAWIYGTQTPVIA